MNALIVSLCVCAFVGLVFVGLAVVIGMAQYNRETGQFDD